MTSTYRVQDVFVYPFKSGAGIRRAEAELDRCGFIDDRRWMAAEPAGRFLTQREVPRLALVRARPESHHVALDAPGMTSLRVDRPPPGAPTRPVMLHSRGCDVVDCGGAAAAWLSQFLGIDCRLVFRPDDVALVVDQTYASPEDRVGLADGFPLLLIGQGSLDELNRRLADAGEEAVPMNRFRPNLVIEGAPPFAEDGWRRLAVGAEPIHLDVVKPCARCSIVPVDQATGVRGVEPLRTLSTFRRRDGGKVLFGQNVLHRSLGTIGIGDLVRVLE